MIKIFQFIWRKIFLKNIFKVMLNNNCLVVDNLNRKLIKKKRNWGKYSLIPNIEQMNLINVKKN